MQAVLEGQNGSAFCDGKRWDVTFPVLTSWVKPHVLKTRHLLSWQGHV